MYISLYASLLYHRYIHPCTTLGIPAHTLVYTTALVLHCTYGVSRVRVLGSRGEDSPGRES